MKEHLMMIHSILLFVLHATESACERKRGQLVPARFKEVHKIGVSKL